MVCMEPWMYSLTPFFNVPCAHYSMKSVSFVTTWRCVCPLRCDVAFIRYDVTLRLFVTTRRYRAPIHLDTVLVSRSATLYVTLHLFVAARHSTWHCTYLLQRDTLRDTAHICCSATLYVTLHLFVAARHFTWHCTYLSQCDTLRDTAPICCSATLYVTLHLFVAARHSTWHCTYLLQCDTLRDTAPICCSATLYVTLHIFVAVRHSTWHCTYLLQRDTLCSLLSDFVSIRSDLDLDECAQNLDNCHPDATCTDTNDSFKCTCNSGFTGDGVFCYGGLSGYSDASRLHQREMRLVYYWV